MAAGHGRSPNDHNESSAQTHAHLGLPPSDYRRAQLKNYQRKTRGPSAAPTRPVITMPSEYQAATNAIDSSVHATE